MRIAMILACAIGLLACGGGKSATQKKAEFEAAAESAANMGTLQLTDLPEGWSLKPAKDRTPEDDAVDAELKTCLKFSADNPATTGVKEIDGATYKGPTVDEISADVTVFATEGAARDAFNLVTADLANCSGNIADLLRRAAIEGFTSGGADPAALDVISIKEDRNIPRLGDASKGVRITVQDRPTLITIFVEFQFIRDGRMTSFVTTSAAGTHTESLDHLPSVVDAKLRAADATLPK